MLGPTDKQIVGKWWNMPKDKSLHLTDKQLGLADNPMIKGGALDSDAGETDQAGVFDIQLETPNDDIESIAVQWYGPDAVFIIQKERNTGIKHTVLLERSEAIRVRDVLNRFLKRN